jgi:hypothetical protein
MNCELVKKTHWRRQYRANDWLKAKEKREARERRKKERKEKKERKWLERGMAKKREQYYRKNEMRVSMAEAMMSALSGAEV